VPIALRKSPSTVEPVGWLIRNAIRPVFYKENSLLKEKRTKKENTKRPVENAAAIDIRKPSGGLRQLLLDADVHIFIDRRYNAFVAFLLEESPRTHTAHVRSACTPPTATSPNHSVN